MVTTKFNGAGELIEQGRTGWVVDNPRDSMGLAQAIEHFMLVDANDVAIRANESMKAYSTEKVFEKMLGFYQSNFIKTGNLYVK